MSVFGIGSDLQPREWRSVFRQLIARGLLDVDLEGHGSLRLTGKARPVLRGEENLALRRDNVSRRAARPKRSKREEKFDLNDGQQKLWEALRAKRLQLAQHQGVPPYVIFNDATLLEMIRHTPRTTDELLQINGVGSLKLERYGETFLGVLAEHAPLEASSGSDR